MPQRLVARVTVCRHVIVHGYELMPHVVDGIHAILKIINICSNLQHKTLR